MHASPRLRRGLRLGLAALTLALNATVVLVPGQAAQAQSATQGGGCGLPDYPIAGGWFYTQEAPGQCVTDGGPARHAGYKVTDDAEAAMWTEFRRFGEVPVLGYPVSQRYRYPIGSSDGYVYQAFERGILQWHPETQRAELVNVFDEFTRHGLDDKLEYFGIPRPQPTQAADFAQDAEQRMTWLSEPQFVARFFFDPVAPHSSDPDRAGEAAFLTQEQAWTFFGLPQSSVQRLLLIDEVSRQPLDPWSHNFYAQRFQKAGLQLFVQDGPETFGQALVDPTIVPGDGRQGCVSLTATGLLARRIGLGKLLPADAIEPEPRVPQAPYFTTFVPESKAGVPTVSFEIMGRGFAANVPITIKLTDGQTFASTGVAGNTQAQTGATNLLWPGMGLLPPVSKQAMTYDDGSFDTLVTARLGLYTATVTAADKSSATATGMVDLTQPSASLTRSAVASNCGTVGLPTWN